MPCRGVEIRAGMYQVHSGCPLNDYRDHHYHLVFHIGKGIL